MFFKQIPPALVFSMSGETSPGTCILEREILYDLEPEIYERGLPIRGWGEEYDGDKRTAYCFEGCAWYFVLPNMMSWHAYKDGHKNFMQWQEDTANAKQLQMLDAMRIKKAHARQKK